MKRNQKHLIDGVYVLLVGGLLLLMVHVALRGSLYTFRAPVLTMVVHDGVGIAKVNSRERLRFSLPTPHQDYRPGLYVFHPDGPTQRFRSVSFRDARTQGPMQTVFSAEAPWRGRTPSDGWLFREGRGLMHRGRLGTRGTLLLDVPESADFELEVAFANLKDAGILCGTVGPESGIAVVLRPLENDLLVFPMEAGRPGALLGIAPLETLCLFSELQKLGGFLSGMLGGVCVLAGALCLVSRQQQRANSSQRLPDHRGMPSMTDDTAGAPSKTGAFIGLAIFVFLVLALVARAGLHGVPHITDETSYLFQARIFAEGHLHAPLPPHPEFFTYEHVVRKDGYWFSKYPPLYPLLLAIGVRLGVPWLVNPLLGGLLVLVMLLLANELFRPRCAWFAGLLTITSPFFVLMSASLMAHTAAALFLSLTWFCGIRLSRYGLYRDALGGGLALAAAVLVRSFSAFCVALPLALMLLWALWHRRFALRFASQLLVFGLIALTGAALLIGWNRTVANLEGLPTDVYTVYDPSDSPGFGEDKGTGQRMTWGSWGHTPAKAVRSVTQYAMNLSHFLFGWPLNLSLLFLPVAFVWGDRGSRRWCLMLLLPWAALLCGHLFYWATEHIGYGPRYWFEGLPGIILVSAAGLDRLFPVKWPGPDRKKWPALVIPALALTVLIGWALTFYFPPHFRAIHHRHSYGNVRMQQATKPLEGCPALVFVPSDSEFYYDGLFLNDPFMNQDLIVARDLGDQNQRLIEQYPAAVIYKWDGRRLMERRSL